MHKSDSQIRMAIKTIYGPNNAKVTRNGEVHVRGTMPNTNHIGWHLLGFTGTYDIESRIWWEDGSLKLA